MHQLTAIPVHHEHTPSTPVSARTISHRTNPGITIALSRGERQQLAALEHAGLELEATVGPRCSALLRAGYKLEIEGATNPAIYWPGHEAAVRDLVLRGR